VVALVIVRWSAAPATTVKVVVSSVRLPLWAVRVIEPVRTPVTVSVATPLTAVGLPRPETVPAPAGLRETSRRWCCRRCGGLPFASRSSAVMSLVRGGGKVWWLRS